MKIKPLPELSLLHHLFQVSDDKLIWKNSPSVKARIKIGGEAGAKNVPYPKVKVEGTSYYVHRIVYYMKTGNDPGELHIDHINGDPTDNNFSNLRVATVPQNQHNRKAKGFVKVRGGFRSRIRFNGTRHDLGIFPTEEEAHQAYLNAKSIYHKEFNPYDREEACA